MRFVRLAIGLVVLLTACDGSATQAPAPLDRPSLEPSPGGGACSETEVDGAIAMRFEADGACLPGEVMVLFRCSPEAVPVLRISSLAGPALFLGGPFAVPVRTLPADVRFAGAADRSEVLIADPPVPGLSPTGSISWSPSAEGYEPISEPEPLVYVRDDGVTERWLRLEGRRGLHDPPVVWVIGDSILDGGRDAVESGLSDWNVTLDAEVGRSTSSGVALAEDAVAQDADAVVVELGTNDFSPVAFRVYLIQTLDVLASVPLVIWQTARGPEGDESIRAVNEAIREIGSSYPNVAIADWEAFVPEEAVQGDGIHPDEGFDASGVRAPGSDARGVARCSLGGGGDVMRTERRARDLLIAPGHERAGGAGIRRLVCIVLGPPDLTWPGGLSMPPAARLARGFCSPRSYLSIACSTVHPGVAVPQNASSGSRRRRMLQ